MITINTGCLTIPAQVRNIATTPTCPGSFAMLIHALNVIALTAVTVFAVNRYFFFADLVNAATIEADI
jgi:hypothetical protein